MKKLYFKYAMFVLISAIVSAADVSSTGKNLLKAKCIRCHSEKIPDNYSKAEWKYNVERMAQRAGLTDKETQSIIELNTKK